MTDNYIADTISLVAELRESKAREAKLVKALKQINETWRYVATNISARNYECCAFVSGHIARETLKELGVL